MGIQYSGGTYRNDLWAGVLTSNAAIADIKTTLVAAGWTSADVFEFITLSASGNAANNETITVDSKVYTFKTVINNANNGEVAVGTDSATSLSNLKAALNLGAGSGTAYSSATTLNTNCEGGTLTSTTLVIQGKVAGIVTPYTISETVTNFTLSGSTTTAGGFKLTSATTPSLLAMQLYIASAGVGTAVTVRLLPSNTSETSLGATNIASAQAVPFQVTPVDLRVQASKYQCFIFQDGAAGNSTNAFFGCGVPWIPDFLEGSVITAATNATPIVVTTSAVHGYTTGDAVTIRGVLGNTAANVTNNIITVLTTTTFSLDASVGNAAYTSGGLCGKVGEQISEAIWSCGSQNGSPWIRGTMSGNSNTFWTVLNGSAQNSSNNVGSLKFASVISSGQATIELTWFDSTDLVTEPFICFGSSAVAPATINGQLWNGVIVRKSLTKDVTGTFDSHNWWNLTDNYGGTGSEFNGSFLHVVP